MSVASERFHRRPAGEVTLDIEGVVDGGVGRQEPLRAQLGLELLHVPFPLSDREMGVFGAIVLAQPSRRVKRLEAQDFNRRDVGPQAISYDQLRPNWLITQHLLEEGGRCLGVSASLDGRPQHLAFVIDGAPEIHLTTPNPTDHFIQMPARGGRGPPAFEVSGDLLSELPTPVSNRFVGGVDAALCEDLLDVAKAQREAIIEPDSLPNDVRLVSMTLEQEIGHNVLFHIAFRLFSGDKLALD